MNIPCLQAVNNMLASGPIVKVELNSKTELFRGKVNPDVFGQRNRFLGAVLGVPKSISALFRSFQLLLGSVLAGFGSV